MVKSTKYNSLSTLAVALCFFVMLFAAQTALADKNCVESLPPYDNTQILKIGIKFAPPFMFEDNHGNWAGLSADLWRYIADCLSLDYEFVEQSYLKDLLDGVDRRELDASLAAITINAKREQFVDFSHPYFRASLGVMVADKQGLASIGHLASKIFGPKVLFVGAILICFMLTIALLYWRSEGRRGNALFQQGPMKGLYNALLWATLLIFSGRGEPFTHKTYMGQIIVVVLMFFGVTIVSSVTAIITSSLTLQSMEDQIQSVEDLKNKKIAYYIEQSAVELKNKNNYSPTSSSQEWLDAQNINITPIGSWPEASSDLLSGKIDALVHDKEIMQYLIQSNYLRDLKVLDVKFREEDYGIVFPEGSDLREAANRVLLHYIDSAQWQASLEKYGIK
ncbi:MAG: transporter substrate-binding domain-containing protein [Cellvibrionaceae bacterium]|nr:transporter substrate-binding domain-containing protein [Cellvibrionaceae bacterium]